MCFNVLNAQLLYTENFNSYPIGNLGTDVTGTIPGQGGWYTYTDLVTPPGTNPPAPVNADYQIVAENGKGNVLKIQSLSTNQHVYNNVYRNDLKTYWQQRSAGNNVLKLAFDYYTSDFKRDGGIFFRNNKGRTLFGYWIEHQGPFVSYNFPDTPTTNVSERFRLSNGQLLVLPKNTWFTFELYVDYDNSNIYYSIPALNYTVVYPITLLNPDGNAENDGLPEELSLTSSRGTNLPNLSKFDNINISAQNTVPVVTVGVNAVLSNSFNLYPNPATNIVHITNGENMLVQQIAVYDTAGKLITTENYNNKTEIQLNVENLASGTYLLHLKTAEGIAVKKLVKK